MGGGFLSASSFYQAERTWSNAFLPRGKPQTAQVPVCCLMMSLFKRDPTLLSDEIDEAGSPKLGGLTTASRPAGRRWYFISTAGFESGFAN